MIEAILIGCELKVSVLNFVDEAGAPITDATITFTVYTAAGVSVAGCSAVPMTGGASGNYEGYATPTADLTELATYYVLATCSNYKHTWRSKCIGMYDPIH